MNPRPPLPSWTVQLWRILAKDMLVEWRGRARLLGLGSYSATMILLFSMAAGADTTLLQKNAPGYIWLAILCASTLLLVQSFQTETESGALEGLVLLPVDSRALFYGKTVANTLMLLLLSAIVVPLAFFLYDLDLVESPLKLALVVLLGSLGVAAPGTIYAALTARIGARQLMLPLLLFPLLIPVLVAAVKATHALLTGDAMQEVGGWLQVLGAFDLLYLAVGGVLFGKLVEE